MGYTTNSGLMMQEIKEFVSQYVKKRDKLLETQLFIQKLRSQTTESESVSIEIDGKKHDLIIQQPELFQNILPYVDHIALIQSEQTHLWRTGIIRQLKFESSIIQYLEESMGKYEAFLKESLWPSEQELENHAPRLKGLVEANYARLKDLEEMFLTLPLSLLCIQGLEESSWKNIERTICTKVATISSFVLNFYYKIIASARCYDPGGNSFRALLGCCFYQPGEHELAAVSLKNAHLARIKTVDGVLLINELLAVLEPRQATERTPLLLNKAFHIDSEL